MKARALRDRSNRHSLLDGLRAEYPVLLRALGADRFERFALAGEDRSRPDFFVDLARLERSVNEVFFGPEDEVRLDPAAVRQMVGEELAGARLEIVASSRLLVLRYPAVDYFRAVRSGGAPPTPAPTETFVLLNRNRDTVAIHQISRGEFVVLGLLKRAETVGDALAVVDSGDDEKRPLGTDARTWIERWAERGIFGSISIQRRPSASGRDETQSVSRRPG